MPVHDWSRVDDGTFHAFHNAWLAQLMNALNNGLLPPDYYALSEQVATRMQTDVLALHRGTVQPPTGGLAVAEAAPQVRLRARPTPARLRTPVRRRRLTVRHTSGHRVVAAVEVTSPANKDRRDSVREFADKVVQLLANDVQVLLVDLLRPGKHDPQGMHGAVWSRFEPAGYTPPPDEPLTLASYRWDGTEPEAFVEPTVVGRPLIDMPLFLNRDRYIQTPLESTYQLAFRALPAFIQQALQA
jgi:hypothetical protein